MRKDGGDAAPRHDDERFQRLAEVWWLVRRASWGPGNQRDAVYALHEDEYQEACDLLLFSFPEMIPMFQALWERSTNDEERVMLIMMEFPFLRDVYHPDRLAPLTTWVEARLSRYGPAVETAWRQTVDDPGRLKKWDKKASKEIARSGQGCDEDTARRILWLNGIDPKDLHKYWKDRQAQ